MATRNVEMGASRYTRPPGHRQCNSFEHLHKFMYSCQIRLAELRHIHYDLRKVATRLSDATMATGLTDLTAISKRLDRPNNQRPQELHFREY
jgi:hypothetical protein